MIKKLLYGLVLTYAAWLCCAFVPKPANRQQVTLLVTGHNNRVQFGADRLMQALENAGYSVRRTGTRPAHPGADPCITIGLLDDTAFRRAGKPMGNIPSPGKEGFVIRSSGKQWFIGGADASGVLYGCMELADRIKATGRLPENITVNDHPQMVLRGACIGVQKSTYLPGRTVYEYPYTPETFPWFYDKQLWVRYLDSMVANRMNSLYLWNGHPFASLVRLKEYPYAVEVDEATFKKNEDMFRFLTTEADKRGIWVIQLFYNIIVSKPFAEHHHIKTQDRNRPILPLIADYTRKSIAAFVAKYPNVGLMVTLGEAMEGVGNDDVEWFTKTIIPGVKDGLQLLGKTEEPPIVLRAHDTDAPLVMKAARPLYSNLYTEAKYNGEALTTATPRGPWAQLHRQLSSLGTVQIENVHIMANLEPFRYGATGFIQQCVQAMHRVYGANGLHLYPQASYWDWPYTADNTQPRLLQLERDWVWYKAWARYAWNSERDSRAENTYWSSLLAARFGCPLQQGKYIQEAYEQSGQIAPKLLRRFGITDGNRQTLTLGMLMSQLINPYRYHLFTLLYNSEGPEGEMLIEYAAKEWNHTPHTGETPVQVNSEVLLHAQKAVEAIEQAAPAITKDRDEFNRLKNDMYCYRALARSYVAKTSAALHVLRYSYSHAVKDLDSALPLLEQSVTAFRELTALTQNSYLYANSMQTQQRKIPVDGRDGKNKTWTELLTYYERELAQFKKNLDSLHTSSHPATAPRRAALENAPVTWHTAAQTYTVNNQVQVFADTAAVIQAVAPELQGLQALAFARQDQLNKGTTLHFTSTTPVKLLVGYFDTQDNRFLHPSNLETDASANDYGQAETKIAHGLSVTGMPPVNIHSYSFGAGEHTLTLGKGICLVLGFVNGQQPVPVYDAGLGSESRGLDWLFGE